jgi:hypothetical protein
MPEWSEPDRSRSRAVLIGTSEYEELTAIPAAANSLDRMHRLLTGPLCAWPEGRVTVLPNERVPGDLAHRLVQLYLAAADVAFFYYVGHGQIDDDDRLCLGLVGSSLQAEFRATTSLTFDAVRAALRRTRARVKIVILDCCFAGKALHGPHTLAGAADVAALAGATGAYTLAATGGYTTAWYEEDRDTPTPQTYFTKYLADVVERGIPGEPAGLTLDPIYWRLREDLPATGKPVPERITRDFVDTFVFARNAACHVAEAPLVSDAEVRSQVEPDARLGECAAAVEVRPQEGIHRMLGNYAGRWVGIVAFGSLRRTLVTMLTVVLVGGILAYTLVPGLRQAVNLRIDLAVTQVRLTLHPTYVPVHAVSTAVSSEIAGYPASFLTDNVNNDYWAADVSRDPQPEMVITFDGKTDLDALVITSGANGPDFSRYARPKTIQIAYSDGTGETVTLRDDWNSVAYHVHARQVTSMTVRITSVYPVADSTDVAMAEIEFQRLQ